jgi:hypothetical protein
LRITKNILLILGILLIVFNLLGYAAGASAFPENPEATRAEKAGYFIGSNLFFITGAILLFISYRINKKLKKRQDRNLVDSLFKDEPRN